MGWKEGDLFFPCLSVACMKHKNFVNFLIGLVIFTGLFSVVKHLYLQPDYESGQKAPDFIAILPDGQSFKLSALKGRYVLLDFWGSWCGPCIREAPALIELYRKYQDATFKEATGFTIVSVAIEKDKNRWLNAIQRMGKDWPYHIIDPATSLKIFNSPIANQYDVKQLPTKFLINEKGLIEGVNMTPEQIDQYLLQKK
jgi:thiol-disulfide isomerase/thioredoxin